MRYLQKPVPKENEMPYQVSTYKGDSKYSINCTGDCVVGDRVCFERACFERATFGGSFQKPVFEGFERVEGTIVRDSYGADKQQHTFTIRYDNGKESLIKGHNLYANGVWRKPWEDESLRSLAQKEKHARGDLARATRTQRRGIDYGRF